MSNIALEKIEFQPRETNLDNIMLVNNETFIVTSEYFKKPYSQLLFIYTHLIFMLKNFIHINQCHECQN